MVSAEQDEDRDLLSALREDDPSIEEDSPEDPDFDFDLDDFQVDLQTDDGTGSNTFCKPRVYKPQTVKYDNAKDLAANMVLEKDANYYCVVSGNFIFGDLLEALIIQHRLLVYDLHVCSLSISQDNIDSLVNIMVSNRCKTLHLTVSSYFYAHERQNLIKYIYRELEDKPWDFVFSVAGIHMKTAQLRTKDGLYITIHGSANMRSSRNIEQFSLTENKDLYDFNRGIFDKIEASYAISRNKGGERASALWQSVQ